MDLLFNYSQEKIENKSGNKSSCDLKLYSDSTHVYYTSTFNSTYKRSGEKKDISFEHEFKINLLNGDINVSYRIINNGLTPERLFRNSVKVKKNDFKLLDDLIVNGIVRGEKKIGYWGVKYYRAVDNIFNILYGILKPKLKTPYHISKTYKNNDGVGNIFELIVDFHLDIKNIKGNNSVYAYIQYDYPKQKWLRKNDNKYIPAILDGYGIKSKYLIGELNDETSHTQIKSLNYICKLFGGNYIDYIKQIPWKNHCYVLIGNKKTHQLKNDDEKKIMIQLIKDWDSDKVYNESFVYSINKLLSIREELERVGYNLKFNVKTCEEFENLLATWTSYKTHLNRGFKYRYKFDVEFLNEIERPIVVNDITYTPKILQTEDDFMVEGFIMKNCMNKQFIHGSIYIFVSLLINDKKRINLQYRKGNLIQSYGRANTDVPQEFFPGIEILTQRFKDYNDIEWVKERYDFIPKKN